MPTGDSFSLLPESRKRPSRPSFGRAVLVNLRPQTLCARNLFLFTFFQITWTWFLASCLAEMKAGFRFQLSPGPPLHQVCGSCSDKGWKLTLHPSLATLVVPLSQFPRSLWSCGSDASLLLVGKGILLRLGTHARGSLLALCATSPSC